MSEQDTSTDAAAETSGDSGEATATEATSTETQAAQEGQAALGDAGKKALDAMKADRNKARDDLKALRTEFDAFKAKAEGKEAEHAAAQESQRIKDEALAAANQRILKAEVRAAAAGKLSDPADALRFMDLSSFEVGDDGEVDADAIGAAINDLIQNKPYLAVQDGKRFQGDADAGTRKEARPAQLSKADVERLSAEGKHEEIVKAKAEGRLADYLAS